MMFVMFASILQLYKNATSPPNHSQNVFLLSHTPSSFLCIPWFFRLVWALAKLAFWVTGRKETFREESWSTSIACHMHWQVKLKKQTEIRKQNQMVEKKDGDLFTEFYLLTKSKRKSKVLPLINQARFLKKENMWRLIATLQNNLRNNANECKEGQAFSNWSGSLQIEF